jgi:hypothetical protein
MFDLRFKWSSLQEKPQFVRQVFVCVFVCLFAPVYGRSSYELHCRCETSDDSGRFHVITTIFISCQLH